MNEVVSFVILCLMTAAFVSAFSLRMMKRNGDISYFLEIAGLVLLLIHFIPYNGIQWTLPSFGNFLIFISVIVLLLTRVIHRKR